MNLQNIITIAKHGNSAGQKALYERYAGVFFRLSFRYVKEQNDAEDCMMEAFIKIFDSLQNFDYQTDAQTEAWMKRILVNQSLKCLRKRNTLLVTDFQENIISEIADENLADDDLSAKQILDLIIQLPDGYRTVFNLYVIEGYSHSEIAELLGVSESTSKSQLFKAKRALRKLLSKEIL
jgi:RNA polymerase sigma-70 factor, ECF subfamily